MSISDEHVGRNIAQARGDMTQQQLADAMRLRGWRWSQSTVWAVERGDRPVRLTEAADLAEVLHVSSAVYFFRTGAEAALSRARTDYTAAQTELVESAHLFAAAQLQLAHAADLADLSAEDVHAVREALAAQPADLVRAGQSIAVGVFGPHPPGPLEQEIRSRLAEH